MLLLRWLIPLMGCLMPASFVACYPVLQLAPPAALNTALNIIEDHIVPRNCAYAECSARAQIINTPQPPRPPQRPQEAATRQPLIHTKRQASHTTEDPEKTPRLTRAQLIGLTVGLGVFAVIMATGLFLWILSRFPLAQERFCACFCAMCCPWLVRRTRDFEWEWD
ncbi:hypothetical protein BJY01DRAFT_245517 [Aspergillus pseudoustus]|uniref:Uncharacterized protein n=1 Tax=Aspergillus pseudoustus TaxID=1810923 RepID=A0ABR4KDI2_9EURO